MKTNMNPNTALERLMEGNRRFTSGLRSVAPLMGHLKMAELSRNGQKPYAIILTCSDSGSPAELIFDEGLGELFVVRVAGNVVAPSLLASIEFAALNFGSSIILVLGHTQCGAIKATVDHLRNQESELPSANLEELVGRIQPAVRNVTSQQNPSQKDEASLLSKCEVENVKRSMKLISEQSQIITNLVKENRIRIEGAVLELSSGNVKFL